MKKIIFILFILLNSNVLFSQNSKANFSLDLPCDTLTAQVGMNMCSGLKYDLVDSIMNSRYDSLIAQIDVRIASEKLSVDTVMRKFHQKYLQQLQSQKMAVLQSRKDFIALRSSLSEIIHYEYFDGSMRPMAVNNYAINLTVSYILQIEVLLEEISH